MAMTDLRPRMFGGLEWYERLSAPSGQEHSAWYCAKKRDFRRREVRLLQVALAFAARHGLWEHYRAQFGGISPARLTESFARRQRTTVTFPIWVIAHELLIAAYLERILGWTYVEHAPRGHLNHRGDWGFRTPSGREVFVEVKCLDEPMHLYGSGVSVRADYRPHIKQALREAYRQLPDDGRATVVVVVGDYAMEISHGIPIGDLFESLYGQTQLRLRVLPTFDPASVRVGPSGRDTHVNARKRHSRMGQAFGVDWQALFPYGVPNTYAKGSARLSDVDLERLSRVSVAPDGRIRDIEGIHGDLLDAELTGADLPDGEPFIHSAISV